ncbi:MAG TPA: insulinase family protein [Candidatus Coprenecus stercoravium]|uniref:Insulinase family protein n=1 Tax=Candidatus Coprenecus stercoravium TaxID=2840735 RepID=A0A9D2K9F9_9BACT|nr:insulinase family protein [Candidatus Coprenecus stercoravium]
MPKLFKMLACAGVTAVALSLAVSCGPKYETVPGDPTGTRIYTLDNGLKVYMSVNKDEPRINAQIAVRVGSKNDPHETTGLAHYFEHLMFKGTESFGTQNYTLEKPLLDEIERLFEVYRNTTDEAERKAIYHQIDSISYEASKYSIPNEYDKLMSAIGASGTNAYTSYDQTVYVENIPSNELENWAIIQSDRFAHNVIRGFHTELEAVYEEKNMSLTNDSRKMLEAMLSSMFKNHPYGLQTVLGSQEDLKNPSITNIKNYYKEWYVPNNMAICLSGDLNPNEAIKVIEKYFGGMQPNPDLKPLEFEPEAPITEPIVTEVLGIESPMVMVAWRCPGTNDPDNLTLNLIANIMYNGTAGLVDINVNHPQRVLSLYGGVFPLTDYSIMVFTGEPKQGQSLDEVRDIILEQIDILRKGEFDEELLTATANNYKLAMMSLTESSYGMVDAYVSSFINREDWSRTVNIVDNISAITKEDIVAYANKYFGDNNYVEVRKLQGEDPNEMKIEKPQITPIQTNRDTTSQFFRNIMARKVKPIEPVFADFEKDMDILTAEAEIPVLYKRNEVNDIFSLYYVFETGSNADPVLSYAMQYLDYLGTDSLSPVEIKQAFYNLACNYSISAGGDRIYLAVGGLGENMEEAVSLFESLVTGAVANPEALESMKANIMQQRANSKLDQMSNFSRLQMYGFYGKDNPVLNAPSAEEIKNLTDEELLSRIRSLFSHKHKILYYGPMSQKETVETINRLHNTPGQLKDFEENKEYKMLLTEENKVLLAPYKSNQIYLMSISNSGETYDPALVPIATMYNSYFGGGMNSIVFQEMREARGLAYSASAGYDIPGKKDDYCNYYSFIATQNDKMTDAIDAFNVIINDMPVSQQAFDIAKESILTNQRTQRTIKEEVLWLYLYSERLGLDHDINRDIYENVLNYTLQDVIDFQEKMVKGRKYTICILGDPESLDIKALEKYGKVTLLSTEEIFGY